MREDCLGFVSPARSSRFMRVMFLEPPVAFGTVEPTCQKSSTSESETQTRDILAALIFRCRIQLMTHFRRIRSVAASI